MPGKLLGFEFGRSAQSESQSQSQSSSPTLPKPQSRPSNKLRSASFGFSSSSSTEARSSDSWSNMDHFKRPSITAFGKHSSAEGKKEKKEKEASAKHVKLELLAESPPALFIGDSQHSTGALYSCKLKLIVRNTAVTLTSLHLKLNALSSTKRPVSDRCPECISQTSMLKDWQFLSEPVTFQPGEHEFPASYLIPGHLPVTTHGHVASIDYRFVAKAVSNKSETFELTKPLLVTRAIPPAGEKHSVRIFPPTNLSLNVTLTPVIHPIGDFNVYARMSGITTKRDDTQTRWRLRKLTWRVEEHEHSISPACTRHAQKVGGEGKGLAHDHTRCIGEDEIKSGWKSDFEDGQFEGEFVCSIDSGLKPNYDVESPNGLKIKHTLVLELVIAEEWAPNRKPNQATPTGAARVLRTQFNLVVTERAGMGIAWDDEMPPMYSDVPASPPAYLHIEDYQGEDLNEDVEHLQLGN